MAAVEHAYRYPFTSGLETGRDGPRLILATSGGANPNPSFFRGRITQPRRPAALLLAVAAVAATRFFVPAATVARILREADPVVTSGGDRLRFESFSVCSGVYSRLDLLPDALDGEWLQHGTTNVDFGSHMRRVLSAVHEEERVGLSVGAGSVEVSQEFGAAIERKVALPERWLRGFVEVQCYQSEMKPAFELAAPDAARFLSALPREVPPKEAPMYAVPNGRGLRLTTRATAGSVGVGGAGRLRILAGLGRTAKALRVYRHDDGASGWELVFDDARFHMVLSPEASRGFSGEGQALQALAAAEGDSAVARVRAALRWQACIRPRELAAEAGIDEPVARLALARLGVRGLVGFDLGDDAWFHRELPFDRSVIEANQPRLVEARELVAAGAVRITKLDGTVVEGWVRGAEVEHRVRLDGEEARCTCPWFSRNQGARGPCKHVLAARLAAREAVERR